MTKYTCLSCGKDSFSADPHKENEPCVYCGHIGTVASKSLTFPTPCEICDPKSAPACTKECQAVCPETDAVGDKCEICGSADRLTAVICKPVANNEFVAKATLCRDCKSTYATGYIRNYYSNLSLAQNLVKNYRGNKPMWVNFGRGHNKKPDEEAVKRFRELFGFDKANEEVAINEDTGKV